MRQINLFSVKQVAKDTYVVTENYLPGHRCTIGVIVGAERVLVIDAGLGLAGDLRRFIEGFVGTGKPIFCICTHGHTDCIGSAALFDETYLTAKDVNACRDSFDQEFCIRQMNGWDNHAAEIEAHGRLLWKDPAAAHFQDMKEGDHFHLGGVHVQIMEIPGHTPGSVAVRVTREGVQTMTFVGDAFGADLNHLHHMNREDLLDYRDRIQYLLGRLNHDEPIYSAHSPVAIGIDIGMDVAKCCEEVGLGRRTADDAPFDFGWPKQDGVKVPDLRVHFFNNSYIVYDRDLL